VKQTGGFCAMEELKYKDTVKEAIVIALIELMKERDINSISIKDIVEKAGVGRSSFYRNFNNKEEILLLYIDYLFDDTKEDHPYDDENLRDFMISYFKIAKKNQGLFLALQRNNLLYLLYRRTNLNVKRSVAFYNLYRNPYQAAFFSGAGISVLIQWIERGFKESEEELTDMFIYLMDGHHREKI
jgi:AcrR family transcriptional regulator